MVNYNIPTPPQSFLARMRDGMRLATAFVKGDKDTISNITAETIFSPLQPIRPFTPNVVGRNWDYQSGINLQFLPRGYGSGRIPFVTLRQFSRSTAFIKQMNRSTNEAPPPDGQSWALGILDKLHLYLIIGTGADQPMSVRSITVWQKDASANLVQ